MDRETSSRASSIASRLIHITPATILDAHGKGHSHIENLCEDIKTLAGSCMSQDETPGQQVPATGDFLSRLKNEREDLETRLIALNSYITHNPGHPNPRHHNMLERQAMLMSEFLAVLDERLADIAISQRSDPAPEVDEAVDHG